MAAGSAAERAETGGIQKARFRGREVVLTFSMQARGKGTLGRVSDALGNPIDSKGALKDVTHSRAKVKAPGIVARLHAGAWLAAPP